MGSTNPPRHVNGLTQARRAPLGRIAAIILEKGRTAVNSTENYPNDAVLVKSVQPWLSKPNIVGVDVGEKTVGGHTTGQRAIVVHVVKKLPENELGAEGFLIPATFAVQLMGEAGRVEEATIPTDVVEVGEVHLDVNDQRLRPAPGGYQIAAANLRGTATLGVNIVWAGRYRLITNNHAIAHNGNLGADVYQPSSGPNNRLGAVDGYIPVITYSSPNEPFPHFNSQDLAFSNLTPAVGSPEIAQVGTPSGLRAPVLGERIVLVGKQTGQVRKASVASITYSTTLQWPAPGSWAWFESLIRLDANITHPGDSGSAYVALTDGKVVGIHVGGGSGYSFGCQLWPF